MLKMTTIGQMNADGDSIHVSASCTVDIGHSEHMSAELKI